MISPDGTMPRGGKSKSDEAGPWGSPTALRLSASDSPQHSRACCLHCGAGPSIEGAVGLPLRIEDALPVVGLVGLPPVRVDEHLDVLVEKTGAGLDDGDVPLVDDHAGERANDGRRGAPVDEFAGHSAPGGAMQRADDGVADDVGALAHGGAQVRAEVANAEEGAALSLSNEHVQTAQVPGLQLP